MDCQAKAVELKAFLSKSIVAKRILSYSLLIKSPKRGQVFILLANRE